MDGVKRIAWTLGLVAVWSFISVMTVYQWDVFSMGSTEWKAVVVAVMAGVGAFLTNYLAPWIKQYGLSKV
ncbi:MAG: hypothetical protein ABFE13_12020 [Phycisphaerales bacterium]